jgi:hypothetical protein
MPKQKNKTLSFLWGYPVAIPLKQEKPVKNK